MNAIGSTISVLRDRFVSGGAGAIIAVLLLFVLLTALAVVLFSATRGKADEIEQMLEERAAHATNTASWPFWAALFGFVLVALFGGNAYLARDTVCLRCHPSSRYAEPLADSVHRGTACSRCHSAPGVLGEVQQSVAYARWIVVYGTKKQVPQPSAAPVEDASCLGCHPGVRRGTQTANGIRVRHADFLDAGARCVDCHSGSAHTVSRPTRPRMDSCVICHDGNKAPADCETCHVRDVAYTPSVQRGFSKIRIAGAPDSCYECHAEKPCLTCHGIRMPHPNGWAPTSENPRAAGHARAGFQNRRVCWRCHFGSGAALAPGDDACSPCHGRLTGYFHGGEAWVREHGLEATGRSSGPYAACFSCHDQGLCDLCHPSSYRQQYNPRPEAPASPGYHPPEWPE